MRYEETLGNSPGRREEVKRGVGTGLAGVRVTVGVVLAGAVLVTVGLARVA